MALRWKSTPLAADRGEISVIAVAESIAAVALSLWIAWSYQTIGHIVISACIAPFLLLRTKRSVAMGFHVAEKGRICTIKLLNYCHMPPGTLREVLFYIASPIIFLVSRVYATVFVVITRPIYSLMNIPYNWRRVVLCTDSAYPPEVMPGLERLKSKNESHNLFSLSFIKINSELNRSFIIFVKSPNLTIIRPIIYFIRAAFHFLFTIIPFSLSLLYRWSLKSTSIVWSPLLWIMFYSRISGAVEFRLNDICNVAFYRAMRWYSVVIGLAFFWKLSIWLGTQQVAMSANLRPLLEPYVEPTRMPVWQICSAVNSLLAVGLYFLADWHLNAIEAGKPNRASEQTIKWQVSVITIVRNTLAIYTIACTLYIGWKIFGEIEWPVFEFILVPW